MLQEIDQLVEVFFSRLGKLGIATQNYKKKIKWFCFGWTVLVTSVVSGKQLLWNGVGGWGIWGA